MSSRIAAPVVFGSIGLIGVAGIAAYLVLQACALPLPMLAHLSGCATDADRTALAQLTRATAHAGELQRQIFELEREVAALQCLKGPASASAPLTPEGWAEESLKMFYGCWALDQTYRTRDIDTGAIRTYSRWLMCFDDHGNGRQTMQSNDGITCEGPVKAQYDGANVQIIEAENLTCDDGGFVHQRQISCALAEGGGALCDTLQPETGGEAAGVGFTRAPT